MKRALNTLFLDRQGEKAITGIPTEDFDHDTVQNPFSPCLSMKRALTTLSLDRQVKKDITRACQDPPKYLIRPHPKQDESADL